MQAIDEIIGKVFVVSWGYDQTNIDFLKVEGLTKSKKSAFCRRISSTHSDFSHVVPTDRVFGPQFKMIIEIALRTDGKTSINLRGSYPFIDNEDFYFGKTIKEVSKRLDWAYLWDGKPEYETPFGLGH